MKVKMEDRLTACQERALRKGRLCARISPDFFIDILNNWRIEKKNLVLNMFEERNGYYYHEFIWNDFRYETRTKLEISDSNYEFGRKVENGGN